MRGDLYLHGLHCSFLQPASVVIVTVPHLHANGLIILGGHFGLVSGGLVDFGGAVLNPSAMPAGRDARRILRYM